MSKCDVRRGCLPRPKLGVKRTKSARNRISLTECPKLGVKRKSISGDWMSACSQKETFVAFLDGMDSGTALGYSPSSGRNPWSADLLPSWPLMTMIDEEAARPGHADQCTACYDVFRFTPKLRTWETPANV